MAGEKCDMSFEYWDKAYSAKDIKYADYDGWLNKYRYTKYAWEICAKNRDV
jgi:hypothetical protein